MFLDWNGNGEVDPLDIGLTLAMLEEEERLCAEEEEADYMSSSVIPDCCLGCPNHPMNGGSATCAFCPHAVAGEPPEE